MTTGGLTKRASMMLPDAGAGHANPLGLPFRFVLTLNFPWLNKNSVKSSSQISSGNLPHLAEFNIPRSRGAAEECLAYDELKACRIVLAKRKTLLHEFKSMRIQSTTIKRPIQ